MFSPIASFFSFFFSINGRLSTRQYWWRVFLLFVVGSMALSTYEFNLENASKDHVGPFVSLLFLFCIPLTIRRYHDLNMSAWSVMLFFGLPAFSALCNKLFPEWTLLLPELIQVVFALGSGGLVLWGIVPLFFGTGDKYANRFGSPNEPTDTQLPKVAGFKTFWPNKDVL